LLGEIRMSASAEDTADARTDTLPIAKHAARPTLPRIIRTFAVPIILGWIAIIAVLNTVVPQLDIVGQMRSVSMSPDDAQSVIATKHMGEVFQEYKSNSSVMIVLEGQNPLGKDAHDYYDQIVRKLDADTKHVEHVQDMWSDPLSGAGVQSNDGKAAYVQVYLAGNQGEALANESVESVQKIVKGVPPPNGVKAYVTGPAALMADQHIAGDRSLQVITTVTFVVIIAMLLLVYRSIVTVLLTLVMVVLELAAARGMVAFLGYHNIILLSTFATNLLVTLAIAAATDYAIFLIGRYQEARALGESREDAYYTMFGGTAHVVLGSGMTIAGATFCLHFTNLPYFQTLGIPLAIGMVVVVAAALTLGPAVISVASRFRQVLEPKRAQRIRGWRKIGALVVRWPGPVLIVTIAVALVGLLTLPGYRTNYNDRKYLPADLPANAGYAAADRHFSQARMNPELMMIESDHDLRNSADFLVIDKVAKAIFRVPGIGRVQAITRPQGTPIEHTSIPFQISMQGVSQQMNQKYQQDQMADMLKQADEMQTTIDSMGKMQSITQQMADSMHIMVQKMHAMTIDVAELRDHMADFEDFFRPIRSYFYWEKHCFDIPVCW
jgi:RND superfamily putative drug exporter